MRLLSEALAAEIEHSVERAVERALQRRGDAPEPYLNTEQAATFLATTPVALRELVSKGLVPSYKPEGTNRLLFKASDLRVFVETA
jgi:hypothetical protein